MSMIGLRNGEAKGREIHLLLPLQMVWTRQLWRINFARDAIQQELKCSRYLYNLRYTDKEQGGIMLWYGYAIGDLILNF